MKHPHTFRRASPLAFVAAFAVILSVDRKPNTTSASPAIAKAKRALLRNPNAPLFATHYHDWEKLRRNHR